MNKHTLSEREQAIRKELALIEKLKDIADDPDAMAYLKGVLADAPVQVPAEQEDHQNGAPRYKAKRHIKNTGARRQMIINLLTGPTTAEDLSQAIKWPYRDVNQSLDSMVRAGLAVRDGLRYALTGAGKAHGLWFQTHPGMKVYKPNVRQ